MYGHIKSGFQAIFIVLSVVLLMPVILTAILYISLYSLWDWGFRRLRKDPKLKLKQLMPETTMSVSKSLEPRRNFFDGLIEKIAHESGATIEETIVEYSDWIVEKDSLYRRRNISLKKSIHTKHASIDFEQGIEEQDEDGESMFYSNEDEGPEGIDINVSLKMSHLSRKLFQLVIKFDQIAAYVCVAILKGHGWYNQTTDQLWCRFEQNGVWVVKYQLNARSRYGIRSSRGLGRAREHWFDDAQN